MVNTCRPTFRKAERLCSKKRIDGLFSGGRSLSAYPLRAIYVRQTEGNAPVEVLVSVPKRHFKHAVDRNRLKRLVREAYRLNKQTLLEHLDEEHLSLAFVWTSNELADYKTVESKIRNLLQRISESLETEPKSIQSSTGENLET